MGYYMILQDPMGDITDITGNYLKMVIDHWIRMISESQYIENWECLDNHSDNQCVTIVVGILKWEFFHWKGAINCSSLWATTAIYNWVTTCRDRTCITLLQFAMEAMSVFVKTCTEVTEDTRGYKIHNARQIPALQRSASMFYFQMSRHPQSSPCKCTVKYIKKSRLSNIFQGPVKSPFPKVWFLGQNMPSPPAKKTLLNTWRTTL